MSSGPGLPGSPLPSRLPAKGAGSCFTKRGRMRAGAAVRFIDSELGARIDNGNHLLLSGNRAALSYIERIGALDTFEPPDEAAIPFVDLADGARWEVRPSRGARAVVDSSPLAAGAGNADARLPRGAAPPAGRPRRHGRGDAGSRHRAVSSAMGAAGRRGAQHLGRAGFGRACSPASSPRRSDAARPRAGRCWRAMDYRKVSSIPRWITCLATAARSASAAG